MALPFPDIDPVALAIGPLAIRWYALAYLAGFLLAWKYALWIVSRDPHLRPNKDDIDNFVPWAVLGVILGGRIGYVLFYQFDLYAADPLEALKVWHGGMSFHGGALGVIVALFGYSFVHKFSLLRLSDAACAGVPIGLFFGRIANFVNGELYGRVTDVPWAFVFPRGGALPRHPSQLYEAILEGLVLFVILYLIIRRDDLRNRPGIVTGVFLAGYGFMRFLVEFVREPDVQLGLYAGFFSMGQFLCIPMILFGAYAAREAYYGRRILGVK